MKIGRVLPKIISAEALMNGKPFEIASVLKKNQTPALRHARLDRLKTNFKDVPA
jgi:hypothetical protein